MCVGGGGRGGGGGTKMSLSATLSKYVKTKNVGLF